MSVEDFLGARSVFGVGASASQQPVACLHQHFPRLIPATSTRTHPFCQWHEGQEIPVDIWTPFSRV